MKALEILCKEKVQVQFIAIFGLLFSGLIAGSSCALLACCRAISGNCGATAALGTQVKLRLVADVGVYFGFGSVV